MDIELPMMQRATNAVMDHSNAGVRVILSMCLPSQMASSPRILNRTARPPAITASIFARG